MRMWNVNPKRLCRKHLLGEHVETHMFAGTIRKGNSLDGYIRNGLVEVHNIRKRHEALAKEIERRGFHHQSKLQKFRSYTAGRVSVKGNEKELRKRCLECFRISL